MVKYSIRTRVMVDGIEGYIMGYKTNPYADNPYEYIVRFADLTRIEYIPAEDIIPVTLPSIEKSENMGEIILEATDLCPITMEPFVDGEEVVQLLRHSAFIYKRESLTEF